MHICDARRLPRWQPARHTCLPVPWTRMEPQTCVSAAAALLGVHPERWHVKLISVLTPGY